MFIEGRFTFASIFEEQPMFYTNLNDELTSRLGRTDFKTILCSDGIVVECETPLENFEGTTFTITVNDVEVEFRVKNRHWVY
jgi:hypothetical protein